VRGLQDPRPHGATRLDEQGRGDRGVRRRVLRPGRVMTALIERIRHAVIGAEAVLDGRFGPRRLVYADYTASGRALTFVEDYIRERVLPLYANAHTEASATRSAHDGAARGRPPRDPRSGRRRSRRRRALLRLRLHRGDHHVRPRARARPPPPASRRLHRPVRAPFERAAWRESAADVVTIREKRRRAAPRPRPPRARAPPPRSTAAEDRQLLCG